MNVLFSYAAFCHISDKILIFSNVYAPLLKMNFQYAKNNMCLGTVSSLRMLVGLYMYRQLLKTYHSFEVIQFFFYEQFEHMKELSGKF